MNTLRLITRSSPLSLKQTEELMALLPEVEYSLAEALSPGDRDKESSLMDEVPSDFFTRDLDRALLDGEADAAVHSAKDLPYPLPEGLDLVCLTAAWDGSDSLVGASLGDLPPGARVGTSSAARRDALLALRPDLAVRSIRGTIGERLALIDNGQVDAIVVATCALHRLGLAGRIAERLPFEAHPLQGMLAVTARAGDVRVREMFASADVRRNYGEVALVGFGPGDPELLTIAGQRALTEADTIFYDDLVGGDHVLEGYAAEKIYVGKRRGAHSHNQQQISEMLYRAAVAGRRVARLKGGDPMIFAHGREEIDCLRSRHVCVRVIPGVTAALAAAAVTQIPLTHRGVASSVVFASGHAQGSSGLADSKLPDADTLVYYMAAATIGPIARRLIGRGRSAQTHVALIHNISLPDQNLRLTTLGALTDARDLPTPLTVVIGDVARFGRAESPGTLVTATDAAPYQHLGRVIHTPLIKIEPVDPAPRLERLDDFEWIVFTSRHGVACFFDAMAASRLDVRRLRAKIASVGPTTTAALAALRLYPDMEPAEHSAAGIVKWFEEQNITGRNILLARSAGGLPQLPCELERLGNNVTDMALYRTVPHPSPRKVATEEWDTVVFASPSGVEAFRKLYGEMPENKRIIVTGKTTLCSVSDIYGPAVNSATIMPR
ncbi:MAG: uroporphyrinogen-III C-methyltransferase [Rikenellaceae bacterium]|nr:uroporphyrinogen-III C-methyltransferase [Rikenellaceae bacterium]